VSRRIVVYTCILGDHDYLRPPGVIDRNAQYVCFADRPIERCAPWEIQPAYVPSPSAARNARIPKILPHLNFQADYSIWCDANFTLNATPAQIIDCWLKDADIAMYAHPCRKHIGEESTVLLNLHERDELPGLDPNVLLDQRARWKHMGAPEGLWAGGLIIRRHTPAVRDFNECWWREFQVGCTRDQIALPMAVHQTGMRIKTIAGNIYESPLMGFHWHAAWKGKGDNAQHETAIAEYQCRRKRLEEIVG
jgi:hypothetical protein